MGTPELAALHKKKNEEWLASLAPNTKASLGIGQTEKVKMEKEVKVTPTTGRALTPAEEKRLRYNAYQREYNRKRRRR